MPQVDWEKNKKEKQQEDEKLDEEDDTSDDSDEIDSDSLSSTDDDEAEKANKLKLAANLSPPRLQIHSTDGDLLLDEQVDKHHVEDTSTFEPDSIECSYLIEDTNRLDNNLPPSRAPPPIPTSLPPQNTCSKDIEAVNTNLKQLQLQDDLSKRNFSGRSSPTSLASHASSKNDDSEENDVTTAAYTETEFSEWARDGDDLVSEDLRDVEYDMNPEFQGKGKRPSNDKMLARMANGEDLTDVELDYSQEEMNGEHPNPKCASTIASKLLANGEEDIDYMDTDNESLLEEDSLKEITRPRNRGYIEFVNFKTAAPTSINLKSDAPIAKSELEYDESSDALTPCCEDNDLNVIEFDPVTIDDVRERLRAKNNANAAPPPCEIKVTDCDKEDPAIEAVNRELMCMSMEEDSLLIVEPHEDTTTSEVVTVLASPVNPQAAVMPANGAAAVATNKDEETSEATETADMSKCLLKISSVNSIF